MHFMYNAQYKFTVLLHQLLNVISQNTDTMFPYNLLHSHHFQFQGKTKISGFKAYL